jgi:hypothetical protein
MTIATVGRPRRPMSGAGLVAAIVLLAAAAPALAATADTKTIPEKAPDLVRFDLGGFRNDILTEGSVSSANAGLGAIVNFEDTFDMPGNSSVFKAGGFWHVAKRQYIDFGWLAINRTGDKVIDQDVEWNGNTFHAGAELNSEFRTQFPYGAWRYDFLQLDKVRISGSAGVSYMGIKAAVQGSGSYTDIDGVDQTGTAEKSVTINFPVPLVGLQLDWALTRTLAIKMYTRLLYIDFAGARGSFNEQSIRLYWYMTRVFGIAGGLDRQSIDLKEYDNGDTKARFRYDVSGIALYLSFAF